MRIHGLARSAVLGILSLGIASTAQAGTNIRLVPQAVSTNLLNPLGHYMPGETFTVNVYLNQTPAGVDHLIRLTKLHFDMTSMGANQLTIGTFTWSFSATGHYLDSSLTTGPAGVAAAYFFENAAVLGPNPTRQILLPGSGAPVLVASFPVTVAAGAVPGSLFMLNVVNDAAVGADPLRHDVEAAVTYGFGCDALSVCAPAGSHADGIFPVTTDRPGANLTGGTLALTVNTPSVVPGPAGSFPVPFVNMPPPGTAITFTHPNDNSNLWRSALQVMRIAFNQNIGVAGPLVPCPGFEVRALTVGPLPATGANFAGGILGTNLNVGAAFTCTIENDPNQGGQPRILMIRDANPADFVHRTWYTVQNVGGWAGANPFRMDYRMMRGDTNNSGTVDTTDFSPINLNFAGLNAVLNQKRVDTNGSNSVDTTDFTVVNATIMAGTGGLFPKPQGHP